MRIVAYVVAALLLFAGCAQDQPKEPVPTAKPSPTATVPSMPAAAQENTVAGAVAFVEHYIDVFNYASNTGDVKELQKLSDPACDGCTEYINLYKKTYTDGGYFKNSDWELSKLSAENQNSILLVFADMTSLGVVYRKTQTGKEQKGNHESSKLAFVPKLSPTGWKLQEFELQKDDL